MIFLPYSKFTQYISRVDTELAHLKSGPVSFPEFVAFQYFLADVEAIKDHVNRNIDSYVGTLKNQQSIMDQKLLQFDKKWKAIVPLNPEDMTLELVEPLRDLFKDEVRSLGTELGLPDEMVWRQPFPGPGLGVRIIGEVTPERAATLQEADATVRAEIAAAGGAVRSVQLVPGPSVRSGRPSPYCPTSVRSA